MLAVVPFWIIVSCLFFFFSVREQKGKSEMKRGSRTGRKAKARHPKPRVITVSNVGFSGLGLSQA